MFLPSPLSSFVSTFFFTGFCSSIPVAFHFDVAAGGLPLPPRSGGGRGRTPSSMRKDVVSSWASLSPPPPPTPIPLLPLLLASHHARSSCFSRHATAFPSSCFSLRCSFPLERTPATGNLRTRRTPRRRRMDRG